jgi:hypothetical protein
MFNRKKEFTGEELEVIGIVKDLSEHLATRVYYDIDSADYILENQLLHYSCIIDNSGVLIVNSVFSLRKSWRSDVLDECKSFAKKRIKTEIESVRNRITQSESEMFSRMNLELNK